ncbi:hypothetical protein BBAD15_g7319 [Beauveria bassiana D1-5]|uniref:Uncharacterized protein n=1 Tax=Beauveria bassiana D1-5 TaxID=1245745 RepID=A0A0A2VM13_BEABA|nr:hypothetical protein BBAD15_g7319 [Beauveria bassiana D1-5]
MDGTQSLNHRASQQTIISLLELDPSPIESPQPSDEKTLDDGVETNGSDTIMAASIDSASTTTGPGLSTHGGHSTIFYLSRIQRYSSYAMSVFTTLHLAAQRSVAASETYLLMTREIYQTPLLEPLLVAAPAALHVGAGIALRLLRRRANMHGRRGAVPLAAL